jgi:two-component system, NtrC family, response regulator AtoC
MATTTASQVLEAAHGEFITGRSSAIQAVNAVVRDVASTDLSVLLSGESGTGKEVYGRLIYHLSSRGQGRLAKLGCTVIAPEELVETVRQANANQGSAETLLLDNVDELDLDCQRVLLSLLQEHETRLQGRTSARLIATTTKELEREIQLGRFRRELYYRLAAVKIRLPALRERREDIPQFLMHFLERSAQQMGRKTVALLAEEIEFLQSYDWPGNIRELENLARQMVAQGDSRGVLGQLQQSPTPGMGTSASPRHASLKAVAREASRQAERDLILKALEKTHWNRKKAAKQLQISYKALLYKIKQMEVPGAELKNEGEER